MWIETYRMATIITTERLLKCVSRASTWIDIMELIKNGFFKQKKRDV
jgi:hypothetical protein